MDEVEEVGFQMSSAVATCCIWLVVVSRGCWVTDRLKMEGARVTTPTPTVTGTRAQAEVKER